MLPFSVLFLHWISWNLQKSAFYVTEIQIGLYFSCKLQRRMESPSTKQRPLSSAENIFIAGNAAENTESFSASKRKKAETHRADSMRLFSWVLCFASFRHEWFQLDFLTLKIFVVTKATLDCKKLSLFLVLKWANWSRKHDSAHLDSWHLLFCKSGKKPWHFFCAKCPLDSC